MTTPRTSHLQPSPPTPAWPSLPAWPLPLIAGLLPMVATLVALVLSMQQELIPACNPFVDGCVSISAARHEMPNHLFRALVLPAAALQASTWTLVASWLRALAKTAAVCARCCRWACWRAPRWRCTARSWEPTPNEDAVFAFPERSAFNPPCSVGRSLRDLSGQGRRRAS